MTATQNLLERSLQLYPNPNEGHFHLTWSEAPAGTVTLQVVDLLGHVVWHKTFRHRQAMLEQDIDLSASRAGIYTLRVGTATGQVVRKMVLH